MLLAAGILRVGEGNFEATLRAEVGAWLQEGENHILLCGMIGSRQGWVEAEYLRCPVGIEELAASVVQVPFFGAEVSLVPGVMGQAAANVPEVMRGEETAAVAYWTLAPRLACIVFPEPIPSGFI